MPSFYCRYSTNQTKWKATTENTPTNKKYRITPFTRDEPNTAKSIIITTRMEIHEAIIIRIPADIGNSVCLCIFKGRASSLATLDFIDFQSIS